MTHKSIKYLAFFALFWAGGASAQTVPNICGLSTTGPTCEPITGANLANLFGTKGDAINGIFTTPTLINPILNGGTINGANLINSTFSGSKPLVPVANNAALLALVPSVATYVSRLGFYSAGDGGAATYIYSASACSLNSGVGDNGSQVQAFGSGCWLASFGSGSVSVQVWGTVGDGITDDRPAIQAAVNAVQTVLMDTHPHLINSANLTIPAYHKLGCATQSLGENNPVAAVNNTPLPAMLNSYLTLPCTLVLNASQTIVPLAHSILSGVNVVNKNFTSPTSMRSALNLVANYSGIGITIGGIDAYVEKSMILGFTTALYDEGFERVQYRDVYGDDTNGIFLDNVHDWGSVIHAEFWPFAIGHVSWSNNGTYAITGVANNGSGLLRVAFTPGAEPPVTGDLVGFTGMQGVPLPYRGRQVVTVIDSTHMDIQGSSWATVYVSTSTTNGSTAAVVLNTAGIGPGMGVSGPGITGGTTVVSIAGSNVVLSNPATATASASVIAYAPATISGGVAYIDTSYRTGRAFSVTNSENVDCFICKSYGYNIGGYLGVNAGWTHLSSFAADGAEVEDANTSGIFIDGGAYDTQIQGAFLSSHGHALTLQSGQPTACTKLTDVSFNVSSAYAPVLGFVSGCAVITGSTMGQLATLGAANKDGTILILDDTSTTLSSILLVGDNFNATPFVASDSAAATRLTKVGVISGAGP